MDREKEDSKVSSWSSKSFFSEILKKCVSEEQENGARNAIQCQVVAQISLELMKSMNMLIHYGSWYQKALQGIQDLAYSNMNRSSFPAALFRTKELMESAENEQVQKDSHIYQTCLTIDKLPHSSFSSGGGGSAAGGGQKLDAISGWYFAGDDGLVSGPYNPDTMLQFQTHGVITDRTIVCCWPEQSTCCMFAELCSSRKSSNVFTKFSRSQPKKQVESKMDPSETKNKENVKDQNINLKGLQLSKIDPPIKILKRLEREAAVGNIRPVISCMSSHFVEENLLRKDVEIVSLTAKVIGIMFRIATSYDGLFGHISSVHAKTDRITDKAFLEDRIILKNWMEETVSVLSKLNNSTDVDGQFLIETLSEEFVLRSLVGFLLCDKANISPSRVHTRIISILTSCITKGNEAYTALSGYSAATAACVLGTDVNLHSNLLLKDLLHLSNRLTDEYVDLLIQRTLKGSNSMKRKVGTVNQKNYAEEITSSETSASFVLKFKKMVKMYSEAILKVNRAISSPPSHIDPALWNKRTKALEAMCNVWWEMLVGIGVGTASVINPNESGILKKEVSNLVAMAVQRILCETAALQGDGRLVFAAMNAAYALLKAYTERKRDIHSAAILVDAIQHALEVCGVGTDHAKSEKTSQGIAMLRAGAMDAVLQFMFIEIPIARANDERKIKLGMEIEVAQHKVLGVLKLIAQFVQDVYPSRSISKAASLLLNLPISSKANDIIETSLGLLAVLCHAENDQNSELNSGMYQFKVRGHRPCAVPLPQWSKILKKIYRNAFFYQWSLHRQAVEQNSRLDFKTAMAPNVASMSSKILSTIGQTPAVQKLILGSGKLDGVAVASATLFLLKFDPVWSSASSGQEIRKNARVISSKEITQKSNKTLDHFKVGGRILKGNCSAGMQMIYCSGTGKYCDPSVFIRSVEYTSNIIRKTLEGVSIDLVEPSVSSPSLFVFSEESPGLCSHLWRTFTDFAVQNEFCDPIHIRFKEIQFLLKSCGVYATKSSITTTTKHLLPKQVLLAWNLTTRHHDLHHEQVLDFSGFCSFITVIATMCLTKDGNARNNDNTTLTWHEIYEFIIERILELDSKEDLFDIKFLKSRTRDFIPLSMLLKLTGTEKEKENEKKNTLSRIKERELESQKRLIDHCSSSLPGLVHGIEGMFNEYSRVKRKHGTKRNVSVIDWNDFLRMSTDSLLRTVMKPRGLARVFVDSLGLCRSTKFDACLTLSAFWEAIFRVATALRANSIIPKTCVDPVEKACDILHSIFVFWESNVHEQNFLPESPSLVAAIYDGSRRFLEPHQLVPKTKEESSLVQKEETQLNVSEESSSPRHTRAQKHRLWLTTLRKKNRYKRVDASALHHRSREKKIKDARATLPVLKIRSKFRALLFANHKGKDYRKLFEMLGGKNERIDFETFMKVAVPKLKLNMNEFEIIALFRLIRNRKRERTIESDFKRYITFDEWKYFIDGSAMRSVEDPLGVRKMDRQSDHMRASILHHAGAREASFTPSQANFVLNLRNDTRFENQNLRLGKRSSMKEKIHQFPTKLRSGGKDKDGNQINWPKSKKLSEELFAVIEVIRNRLKARTYASVFGRDYVDAFINLGAFIPDVNDPTGKKKQNDLKRRGKRDRKLTLQDAEMLELPFQHFTLAMKKIHPLTETEIQKLFELIGSEKGTYAGLGKVIKFSNFKKFIDDGISITAKERLAMALAKRRAREAGLCNLRKHQLERFAIQQGILRRNAEVFVEGVDDVDGDEEKDANNNNKLFWHVGNSSKIDNVDDLLKKLRNRFRSMSYTGTEGSNAKAGFDAIDKDKDGVISFVDLKSAAVKNLKLHVDEETLGRAFIKIDANRSGYIEFLEFCHFIGRQFEPVKEEIKVQKSVVGELLSVEEMEDIKAFHEYDEMKRSNAYGNKNRGKNRSAWIDKNMTTIDRWDEELKLRGMHNEAVRENMDTMKKADQAFVSSLRSDSEHFHGSNVAFGTRKSKYDFHGSRFNKTQRQKVMSLDNRKMISQKSKNVDAGGMLKPEFLEKVKNKLLALCYCPSGKHEGIRMVFDLMDQDEDRRVSINEFARIVRKRVRVTDYEIELLYKRIDVNKRNAISCRDFSRFLLGDSKVNMKNAKGWSLYQAIVQAEYS
eukprot:g3744.t1